MRTAYDFSPLYRSMIGVDRMADLIDNAMRSEGDRTYPPYDVEKTGDDGYRISLAAAGFGAQELEITAQPNLLIVAGRKAGTDDDSARAYLHRGIAARGFQRAFVLADGMTVEGATLEHGLLHVDVAPPAEPPAPTRIAIRTAGPEKL